MTEALQLHYGYLFEPELLEEIRTVGSYKKVSQGQTLMEIGDNIKTMPLLLSGAIKVLREDDDGNELLLYFVEKGDTCAMTFSCCMGDKKSGIRAVAETDTELLMIPVGYLETWMGKYKTWQQFILDSYHARMMELMETIDTLAFLRMDERLLKHLQDKAKVTHDDVLYATHQEIAYDLHTSRVVVSRLLKKMENEGKIELYRNQIKVLDL
ncbi:CRP/FNR family transcriptional regulator, anaerobic regulatory protein [Arenibacter palladensis]|jgi:CRP/FNR family transcriptional regulator, anaerobic regulatory protein|uniref:CRP/FNR family transcriptional regulator, anaerobic regulatory protein n=1 Tax=Arenibacter palladensis TaxID=237373 RepID=A0A1M5DNL1_9FLAO|nr:Crp/Fnr family transcriptional regulator [Arenibacter palladensis]MDO6603117.1 Crp/Fnr family transcriptional regulator [Arenibacter palladensis]SHF68461.1 CRP/FNR family transcriptional regulator, anaerobic regulatory protein [Arenibacter palladensis]